MKRPTILLLALAALLATAEGVRLWWYAGGKDAGGDTPVLTWKLPTPATPGVEFLDLRETRSGAALAYDRGQLVRFSSKKNPWSMDAYYFEDDPGNRRQLKDIFDHTPEICMRVSGATLEGILPPHEVTIGGQAFRIRHLIFRHPVTTQRVDIFKFVWLARMEDLGIGGTETDFRRVRLQAAWGRHQHPAARLILAGLTGAASDEKAWEIFERHVVQRCTLE